MNLTRTRTRNGPPQWVQVLANHKAAEMLVAITGSGSMALGIILLAAPNVLAGEPTFRIAMAVPHWIWALMWIIPAVWMLASSTVKRSHAIIPSLILAGSYAAWSLCAGISVLFEGIPTAVATYSIISLCCCATAILCTAPERGTP